MPDDSNAREMEAALHEDDEPEVVDPRSPEEIRAIEEEALAEEEFVADQEDTVNPLIFDGETPKEEKPEVPKDKTLDGAFGSEGLAEEEPVIPVSNEEELRKESVNEDELNPTPKSNDLGTDSDLDTVVDEISSLETELSGDGDAAMAAAEPEAPLDGVDSATAAPEVAPAPEAAEPTMNNPVADAPTEAAPVEEVAPAAEPEPTPEVAPAEPVAEPAPEAAPIAEPAPEAAAPVAPQPIPAGMPTTSNPTEAAAPAPAEKPKKKKTGLIVCLIILFVLLVGGGIFAVIWYNQHEAPEKQVSDAIENILDAPVLGTVAKTAALADGDVPSVGIEYTSKQMFKDKTLSASVAFKDSSSVYFRLGGLDAIVDVLKEDSGSTDAAEKELADKVYKEIVDTIDNQWIGVKVESSDSDSSKYKCLTEAGDKMMSESFRKKVADAYKKKPFIKYKDGTTAEARDGINYYEVEIVEDASDEFGEALEDTDEVKELQKCIESIMFGGIEFEEDEYDDDFEFDDDDFEFEIDDEDDDDYYYIDEYEEEDLDSIIDNNEKEDTTISKIYLGITPWSHELRAIEIDLTDSKDSDYHDVMRFVFDSVSGGELDSAKDAEKVVEDLSKTLNDVVADYYKKAIEDACKEYEAEGVLGYVGYSSVQECIDDGVEYFENSDTDVLDMIGGNLTSVNSISDFSLVNNL